jgi:hypothetical protein
MDQQVHSTGPAPNTGRLGGTLTVIYTAQSEVAQKKTRGALLPLLVVLFLISYGILTLLVVEQGRTIDAQRNLLREMLKDSTQLASLKNKLAHEDSAPPRDKAAAQTQQKDAASGSPTSAAPKTPSKEMKHPGKTARTLKSFPEKPAADLQDVRRSTRVI